jgi:hypothetical protein
MATTLLDPYTYTGGTFPSFLVPGPNVSSFADVIRVDAGPLTQGYFSVGTNDSVDVGQMFPSGTGAGLLIQQDLTHVPLNLFGVQIDLARRIPALPGDSGDRTTRVIVQVFPNNVSSPDHMVMQFTWNTDALPADGDFDNIYYAGSVTIDPYDPVNHRWLKVIRDADGYWSLWAGANSTSMSIPIGYLEDSEQHLTMADDGVDFDRDPIHPPATTQRPIVNLTEFQVNYKLSGGNDPPAGYALLPHLETLGVSTGGESTSAAAPSNQPVPFVLVDSGNAIDADGVYVFGIYLLAWRSQRPVYVVFDNWTDGVLAQGADPADYDLRWGNR